MALDNARAEETPFPPPDISSPNSNLANFAIINSNSEPKKTKTKTNILQELIKKK